MIITKFSTEQINDKSIIYKDCNVTQNIQQVTLDTTEYYIWVRVYFIYTGNSLLSEVVVRDSLRIRMCYLFRMFTYCCETNKQNGNYTPDMHIVFALI